MSLDQFMKDLKKDLKTVKEKIPEVVKTVSESVEDMDKLKKLVKKETKKISKSTLKTVSQEVMKRQGYKVAEEGKEVVAVKGKSRVLLDFYPKAGKWEKRMEKAKCTKGILFSVEDQATDLKNTEVKSVKNLMDWVLS